MMTGRTKNVLGYSHFWDSLTASLESSPRSAKVHNYTHDRSPLDYVFEKIEGTSHSYMTGQGKGIVKGDYILLSQQGKPEKYQIQAIDYYTSPSDMWSALLAKVD